MLPRTACSTAGQPMLKISTGSICGVLAYSVNLRSIVLVLNFTRPQLSAKFAEGNGFGQVLN